MTAKQLLASLKSLYKKLMFEQGWTMTDIDNMDIQFFYSLHEEEEQKKVYIDEIW